MYNIWVYNWFFEQEDVKNIGEVGDLLLWSYGMNCFVFLGARNPETNSPCGSFSLGKSETQERSFGSTDECSLSSEWIRCFEKRLCWPESEFWTVWNYS